jgi:peptide/nickel transport system substrate-binding protein
MPGFVSRRAFLRGIIAATGALAATPVLHAFAAPGIKLSVANGARAVPLDQGFGGSGLPITVPRDQVYVVDQIFRYSVANNFNMFVPGGPPTPTRQGLVMDTLWYIDQDSGEWINSLAADKPVYNDDKTEMLVQLRPGVMWSDGTEFSADDVVFTVNTLINNPGLVFSAEMKLYVNSVSAVDPHNVSFKLNEPNPRFHFYFTARYNAVYMMSQKAWGNQPDIKTFTNYPPVSLGAYVAQDSDPNGYWELFKRRDDWQATTPGMITGQPGPPYILTIFYGPSQSKVIAMARHELDVLFDLDYDAFKPLLDSTPSARSWFREFPWAYGNELDTRYFAFNYTIPPYDNKEVRWALALAMDIAALNTDYIGGVAKLSVLPVPATPLFQQLYHIPLDPWLRAFTIDVGNGETFAPYDPDAPGRIATWASQQGYSVPTDTDGLRARFGLGTWKHAPDVAEKLLLKNGFKRGGDNKWMTPDGKPWSIPMLAAPDENDVYRLALGAQDQLKAFGVDIQVETLERDPYTTRQNTGDFTSTSTWGNVGTGINAHPDIWQGFNGLHSRFFTPVGTSVAGKGGTNIERFKFPDLDTLIEQMGKLSPDDAQVQQVGMQIMQLWVTNMVRIQTISFKKFITQDTQLWQGFPTAEAPTRQPLYWFIGGRFTFAQVAAAA